jgi:hypothetical protein
MGGRFKSIKALNSLLAPAWRPVEIARGADSRLYPSGLKAAVSFRRGGNIPPFFFKAQYQDGKSTPPL